MRGITAVAVLAALHLAAAAPSYYTFQVINGKFIEHRGTSPGAAPVHPAGPGLGKLSLEAETGIEVGQKEGFEVDVRSGAQSENIKEVVTDKVEGPGEFEKVDNKINVEEVGVSEGGEQNDGGNVMEKEIISVREDAVSEGKNEQEIIGESVSEGNEIGKNGNEEAGEVTDRDTKLFHPKQGKLAEEFDENHEYSQKGHSSSYQVLNSRFNHQSSRNFVSVTPSKATSIMNFFGINGNGNGDGSSDNDEPSDDVGSSSDDESSDGDGSSDGGESSDGDGSSDDDGSLSEGGSSDEEESSNEKISSDEEASSQEKISSDEKNESDGDEDLDETSIHDKEFDHSFFDGEFKSDVKDGKLLVEHKVPITLAQPRVEYVAVPVTVTKTYPVEHHVTILKKVRAPVFKTKRVPVYITKTVYVPEHTWKY